MKNRKHLGYIAVVVILILMLTFGTFVPVGASQGIGLIVGPTFDLGLIEKGQTYHIGQMCVVNTGDEAGWYKMDVSYLYGQTELPVPKEWVTFVPQRFYLYPGVGTVFPFDYAQKVVQVYLTVPKNAPRGAYFCYLEASIDTGSWLSIAVAARLKFTVVAHLGQKIYDKR